MHDICMYYVEHSCIALAVTMTRCGNTMTHGNAQQDMAMVYNLGRSARMSRCTLIWKPCTDVTLLSPVKSTVQRMFVSATQVFGQSPAQVQAVTCGHLTQCRSSSALLWNAYRYLMSSVVAKGPACATMLVSSWLQLTDISCLLLITTVTHLGYWH